MTRRIGTMGCLLLVLALLVGSAAVAEDGRMASRATQVVGADLRISGPNALWDDAMPAVAYNTARGEYLVVWSDARFSLTSVYGRRITKDGVPAGPDFRISSQYSGFATAPAVAWNATRDEYLVVWGDDRATATRGRDIYGRRVDGNGTLLGNDVRVSGLAATDWEYSPAVAWDPVTATYLVVWEDGRSWSTRSWDIYGRRMSSDGKTVGGEILISGPNATAEDSLPDVAASSGQFLVVWEDGRNFAAGKGYDVYGRRVSAIDGSKLGGDFRINRFADTNQTYAAVAWNDGTGQYLVVWQDGRNYATGDWDIYGRRVAQDGTRVGGDIRVTSEVHEQYTPDVAVNETTSGYLVVWEDWRNFSTRGSDTYARRLAADGTRVGRDFRVSGNGGISHEDGPALAYGVQNNQFFPVWSDWRWQATRGTDIVGRRVIG